MNTFINNSSYARPTVSSGFTLIELMVTVAILAIIVSIAAPNISTQLANQRIKSTTATLNTALKEAKIESVIRRQTINVSFNNNGDNVGAIEIKTLGANPTTVSTYAYDNKSTIDAANNTEISFRPNKTADNRVFTICDSNTAATARQITVSSVANITSQVGGSC